MTISWYKSEEFKYSLVDAKYICLYFFVDIT